MPEKEPPRIFGQNYLEEQTLNYIELTQEEISRRNESLLQRNRSAVEAHRQKMDGIRNHPSFHHAEETTGVDSLNGAELKILDEEGQTSDSDDDVDILCPSDGGQDSNLLLLQQLIKDVREENLRAKAVLNQKPEEATSDEDTFLYEDGDSDFNSGVYQTLVHVQVPSTREGDDGPNKKFSWTETVVEWLSCPGMGITRHKCFILSTVSAVATVVSTAAVFSVLCPTMQAWGDDMNSLDNNTEIDKLQQYLSNNSSKGPSSNKLTITSLIYLWTIAFFPISMEFEF